FRRQGPVLYPLVYGGFCPKILDLGGANTTAGAATLKAVGVRRKPHARLLVVVKVQGIVACLSDWIRRTPARSRSAPPGNGRGSRSRPSPLSSRFLISL